MYVWLIALGVEVRSRALQAKVQYRKWKDRRGRRRKSEQVRAGSGADQLGSSPRGPRPQGRFPLMRSHMTACPAMAGVGDPEAALRPSSKRPQAQGDFFLAVRNNIPPVIAE
ncbi:hypothetical protein LY76DRAFT_206053 [Colletotrichum caudatum]|nr:hypothetical protein LY76DRAFT_206053 [Colletotrichum caudatum]